MILALSDAALIAVLATLPVLTTALGAMGLAWLTGKQRRDERREDREEREQVAARAEELLASNQTIATVTALTAKEIKEVKEQGNVIHGLVNASYTAALEATRVALVGQLDAKRALSSVTGTDANGDITAIQDQIGVLETTIADRLDKQHLAEEQVAQGQVASTTEDL